LKDTIREWLGGLETFLGGRPGGGADIPVGGGGESISRMNSRRKKQSQRKGCSRFGEKENTQSKKGSKGSKNLKLPSMEKG